MRKLFFLVLLNMFITFPILAGGIEITPDAPALLKIASYILSFLSANIQNQTALFVTWFLTMMLLVQTIFRALAELLGLFADKTSTDIDNKLMLAFSAVAKIAGTVIGWFGVGNLPKSLR
jgi:hypothetical protein